MEMQHSQDKVLCMNASDYRTSLITRLVVRFISSSTIRLVSPLIRSPHDPLHTVPILRRCLIARSYTSMVMIQRLSYMYASSLVNGDRSTNLMSSLIWSAFVSMDTMKSMNRSSRNHSCIRRSQITRQLWSVQKQRGCRHACFFLPFSPSISVHSWRWMCRSVIEFELVYEFAWFLWASSIVVTSSPLALLSCACTTRPVSVWCDLSRMIE